MRKALLMKPQKSKVLVADHDEASKERIASLLTSVGYDVVALESVDHLLRYRRREGTCCLVMEFRLQGMNGLDLCGRLASDHAILPVIFTSAHADVAIAVRAMKAGAIDFLAQPICHQALLDAVQTALEQDAHRQARRSALDELETLYESLSSREREVMWHVTAGLMNKQVAGMMGLSEITVKIHRGNAMRKMKARSFADLIQKSNSLPEKRDLRPNELPLPAMTAIVPFIQHRPNEISRSRAYA